MWLDGVAVSGISGVANLGSAPVGILQVGETQTGLTYDVAYDDAAFGTSRLGSAADGTPPSAPSDLSATASSAFSVDLSWTAAMDNVGIAGYDIRRDGAPLATVTGTSYTDVGAVAASTYSYEVRARDTSGNASNWTAPVSVTTPSAPIPVFADGFESGDLGAWTSSGGLVVESGTVRSGAYAAEASTTNGGAFAEKSLGGVYADGYVRVGFEVVSQASQVNLVRLRDGAGNSIGYAYVTSGGRLGFHDDATGVNTPSATIVGPGWHALELHVGINGASGVLQVWLDGASVGDVSATMDLGSAAIGILQIGETQTGQTYDVVYDDAAFGTSRLGPTGDVTPPLTPAPPTVTATSAFSVQVDWIATSDDLGVTSYDVFRDGALLVAVGPTTMTYTDTTVLASSTHTYAVPPVTRPTTSRG